ncbi:hypothetical protein BD560DRAFT_450003 [Blakeslea trispora]|nr:hypothetical protein BD560DRAFT_450003 [Blakeslea trispora]
MAPNNNKKNFGKNEPKTPVTNDPRFSRVHNDPRFVRPKKKDMKVTIDKRFASMMTSKEFSSGPRVDKYGRRLDQDTAEKELKRFYELDEQEASDDDYSDEDKTVEQLEAELAADEENLEDEESEEEEDLETTKKFYDPMRGRGEISSSDEDDTDASEEEEDEEEEEEEEESNVKHIPEGEETSRLALVNMDWDKIKAVDILKVLNGFKPDTGVIQRVSIYPSEFGKERLKQEETQGPPSEIFKSVKSQANESESESEEEEITAETMIKNQLEEGNGQDFDQDALRKYQLDRLKYYYAVIECDSPQTAKVIYKTCDNTEYESSANFFDLRYIPDDMKFDEDEPKEVATVAPENYTPSKFQTDALRRTKVSLTWDEDDMDRYQVTRRDFTKDDLKDLDFDIYLASSDEEEDEEEDLDALREKYKKLLGGSKNTAFEDKVEEDDQDEGDMEITFTPGLSEAAGALVKDQEEQDKEETSIQTYLRKQKEKRKAKKAAKQQTEEADASDMDEETANDPFFKEAMVEMEEEGLVDNKKEKKKSKKRASKEEREQKARERAELELLMDDDGKGEGFNMKEVLKQEKMEKKKKKGKKVEFQQDDFEIDVQDPRFAAVQESHHFAIDPTNPQFKKTKSMQKLMNARQQKMKESHVDQDEWKKSAKKTNAVESETPSKSSLNQLVASVKRKGALDKSNSGKRQKKQ